MLSPKSIALASSNRRASCARRVDSRVMEAAITEAPSPSRVKRAYRKSGVFALKHRLKVRGLKALDQRTHVARSAREWRERVVEDLGGDLSTQEQTVLDMAACAWVLLGVIDARIASDPAAVVNWRKRSVVPLVKERTAIAAHLKELLVTLGLKRRVREVGLSTYTAQRTEAAAPRP